MCVVPRPGQDVADYATELLNSYRLVYSSPCAGLLQPQAIQRFGPSGLPAAHQMKLNMTRSGRDQQGGSYTPQQFTDTGDLGLELDIGCVFAV
jgi:hypothetical protein